MSDILQIFDLYIPVCETLALYDWYSLHIVYITHLCWLGF